MVNYTHRVFCCYKYKDTAEYWLCIYEGFGSISIPLSRRRRKQCRECSPVQGATIIGDGATALKNIRAIGNDLKLDPGVGNCGKAGQWVPVGVGQPTLMIGGLTVGGAKI